MVRIQIVIGILFLLNVRANAQLKSCYRKELQAKDTVVFGAGKTSTDLRFKSSVTMGSFDGTKLKLENNEGIVTYKDVSSARGKHQSELDILDCFGQFTSNKDTLVGKVTSSFNQLFLVDVSRNYSVDSFTNSVIIKLISKTIGSKSAQTLLTIDKDYCSMVALPYFVSFDESSKVYHRKSTLAFFTHFEVIDEQGVSHFYVASDYILIGGNHFKP